MTDDDLARDAEVARALDAIAVPGYEPGFWDRLDARLEHEGTPGRVAEVPRIVVVPPPTEPVPAMIDVLDLPAPVPARRGRDRRRSLVVLAAAAAAVVAIVAVRLGETEPGSLRVAGGETGGGTPRLGPDDGTTTPDAASEKDGAQRAGDDDDGGPEPGGATDRAHSALMTPGSLFSASTTVVGGTSGVGGATSEAHAVMAPKSAQEAFFTWATAIDAGDIDTAVALTGPRTVRYYEALGSDVDDVLADSGEAWGVWAEPDGRHVQLVELGEVDGDRAVGLVLDRPSTDPEDADGRTYDGIPVVRGTDGWKVEPAAFDPSKDGRIELISPEPGPDGLQPIAKGSPIRVAAQRTGAYFLSLDLAQSTTIAASDAVDGEIRWTPTALRATTASTAAGTARHVLVVAHLDEGQITMLAQTFETAPA